MLLRSWNPASAAVKRLRLIGRLGLLALLTAAADRAARAEPAAEAAAPSEAVLHLRNGGHVQGDLAACEHANVIRWRGLAFVEPFEFVVSRVNAVHYPPPAAALQPAGDYCFELTGGGVLFGALVALDEQRVVLDVPRMGRLHARRAAVNRMYRWRSSADIVYLGPNGLAGWRETTAKGGWKEERGQPSTDREGAAIHGDLKLPASAIVEVELSWRNRPDFVLALGVGDDEKSFQRAFRFEVWESDLILQRETEQEADVASVGEIIAGPGRVHLVAYLDQQKGRALVFTADGKPLADLKVSGGVTHVFGGITLVNKRGDVRLERLRVSRWNGEPPRPLDGSRSRIHRTDGSIVYGQVKRFDETARTMVLQDGAAETPIAEQAIAAVYLSPAAADPPRSVSVVYQDGTRISGDLVRVDDRSLVVSVPGIEETLVLPREGLRSLLSMKSEETQPAIGGQAGVLELKGVRLPGRLVDGREGPAASCLVWQPQGSTAASPLRPGVSGRIVYREPPPPRPAARPAVPSPPARPRGFVEGFISALSGGQPAAPATAGKRKSLYLRSGDVIPCDVVGIDEKGVTFRTSLSAATFVSHDRVQAVDLAHPVDSATRLSKASRERLLTLPRIQRENPPTHLIRARGGDYLRGRLLKLDGATLQLEIRLETRSIPRDRLATIIWLHPEQLEPARNPGPTPRPSGATRVQAVCSDGVRLTFLANSLNGEALSGTSDVLGPCRFTLESVDQLLIGEMVETSAAQLAFQQWKLRNAREPKEARNLPSSGTESPLVGKPAPDFELGLLSGGRFRLSQARGKVVILDFWATWCGPCLQTMPQVEQVAAEFRDRNVQLLAVNLQEEPKEITAILQRHKLNPAVVLDRDGAVADRYAATAIPQTVIIDREGTIVRLFVGGGSRLADQLREALNAALEAPGAGPPAPPAPPVPSPTH